MAKSISEMLAKFTALSLEEKQIASELEDATKEYNDYCSSSEMDLNKKIQEIRDKMGKLQHFISYAREHARESELEEAQMAFETPEGTLESIRQTIKLDSHNDANAETLYVKATGQKKFYEQKIEQTRNLIESSKRQARHQYDNTVAVINERRAAHEAEVKRYIESDEFKSYLKLLMFDKSAFNSTGTANLPDKSFISLGQRRVKLSVPMEIEQDLVLMSNGEYNSAAHTIGAPQHLSMLSGSVLMADYDDQNKQILLGGIQRLLLNIIKYYGQDISEMLFIEPEDYSAESLGSLALLGKGISPFIIVPQSAQEAELKFAELYTRAEMLPTADRITRVAVLNGFPEKYSNDTKARVMEISKKAEQLGVLLVLTRDNSTAETPLDIDIRSRSMSVRSRNGNFWIEGLRESMFWYSAPSELPEDVRKVYVEQRRQQASLQAVSPVSVAVASPSPVTMPQTASMVMPTPTPSVMATPAPSAAAPVPPPMPTPEPAAVSEPAPAVQGIPSGTDVTDEAVSDVSEDNAEAVDSFDDEAADQSGPRDLPTIFFGKDVHGRIASIDISGNVAYLCGVSGDDRRNVTELIIGTVTSSCHPDDAEMWIFDQTGEFDHLVNDMPPHVRYYIADSSAQTLFDLTDVLGDFLESRAVMFKENGWNDISEVPADEYMPHVIVVLNEFPSICAKFEKGTKFFGKNYQVRLTRIMRSCAKFGFHFLLTGESFPDALKASDVHSAAAVYCRRGAVGDLFNDFASAETAILGRIPAGSVFTGSSNGTSIVPIVASPITFDDYHPVFEYLGAEGEYLDKSPIVSVRTSRVPFSSHEEARELSIANRDPDETLLFLGEPCRFVAEYPVRMYHDFGENLLAVMPGRESRNGVLVVLAAVMSLLEQGMNPEILAFRSNPVYNELLRMGVPEGVTVLEGDDIIKRVKELSAKVGTGENDNSFVIVLGGDSLMTAMHAKDCLGDLKKLLVEGPRAGLHFIFTVTNLSNISNGLIMLFKHRLVFACPESDAQKVLRDMDVELPENAFRLSNDFEELTVMPYMM